MGNLRRQLVSRAPMDSATANSHLRWSHASLEVDEADSKDAPYFEHYSLDLRDERQNIRLLQMLPSAVGDLRFTMFNNVFLDENPIYVALSYE